MRQDQYLRLQELTEAIADVVIHDADPKHWIGQGKRPGELTKEQRGDAYWCRKIAISSISVLTRVESLIGQVQAAGAGTTPTQDGGADDPLDAEVEAAEKEAAKLLADLQSGASKASFDRRVHGSKAR